jgi:lipid II:glycine glycyltransferase (peptidoglycan interpeptide bridge formation enzyme)
MPCTLHVDKVDRRDWERYASDFADYSIYQTWPYQQIRAETDGQEVNRVVIEDEHEHISMMGHVRIKKIRTLGIKIGYMQWGPLLRGRSGELSCNIATFEKLTRYYLGKYVNVLRLRPNVIDGSIGRRVIEMLECNGFERVHEPTPYRSIILPLEGSEEDLKRTFNRNWRRNLKKAEKAEVKIEQECSSSHFDVFEKLYAAALKRKRFKGLDPQEFAQSQSILSPEEKMTVTAAYFKGEATTVLITSNLGDTAVDILAANSEKALQCGSSFLVYWKAFCTSKRAGMKRYDLGGIDPENNPTVYNFKRGTRGEEVFHIGTFDICSNSVVKRIWRLGERSYRLVRR